MPSRSFDLSEDDFVLAQRLMYRSSPQRRIFRQFIWALLGACVAGGALTLILRTDGEANLQVLLLVGAAVCAALLYRTHVGFPQYGRKLYRQLKSAQETITLEWSPEEVRSSRLNGHVATPLRDLTAWAEDATSLVLLFSDVSGQALPKRCFSEAELAELRQWLAAAGVRRR